MSHRPRHRRPAHQREFRRREPVGEPDEREVTAPGQPVGAPLIARTVAATPLRTIAPAPAQPAVDYAALKRELGRIAVIAGSMFAILIILSFFLR
ncbi:MAG: hypothetical protein HYY29_01630 [Chloroflexi bacterium]|nr:hypothetical protein [Chloroflexota bacterium]